MQNLQCNQGKSMIYKVIYKYKSSSSNKESQMSVMKRQIEDNLLLIHYIFAMLRIPTKGPLCYMFCDLNMQV